MMPANYRPSMLMAGMATASAMDTTMEDWRRQDVRRTDYMLQAVVDYEDQQKWILRDADNSMPTMCGQKNVSPYRVHYRRQKNKAARKARRRNRKP